MRVGVRSLIQPSLGTFILSDGLIRGTVISVSFGSLLKKDLKFA